MKNFPIKKMKKEKRKKERKKEKNKVKGENRVRERRLIYRSWRKRVVKCNLDLRREM
jgi:hypothetical protein